MIRKINFSNFYSFKNKQEISFLTNKKKSYDYFISKNLKNGYNEQITKVAGFISKNAAGKTNVIRALGFIGFFASTTNKGSVDLGGSYKTFFNNNKRSNFLIEFEINDEIYEYSFSLKNNLVDKEQLKHGKIVVYNFSNGKKFYLNEKYSMDIVSEKVQDAFEKNRNMSFMAFANNAFGIDILKKVIIFFNKFVVNINELGEKRPEIVEMVNSSKQYNEDNKLKKEMEDFINNFDLGPEKTFDIIIQNKKNDDGRVEGALKLDSINKIKDTKRRLPFIYESAGTRTIYCMLAKLFFVLRNNGTLILDEIEIGLHPEALSKLIQYFIDKNDKGRAQLFFSTHDLDFLKKFNKDQIFLVEKNNDGESEVQRLDKKNKNGKNRTEDNLLAKYKSGLYGAYPDIRI